MLFSVSFAIMKAFGLVINSPAFDFIHFKCEFEKTGALLTM